MNSFVIGTAYLFSFWYARIFCETIFLTLLCLFVPVWDKKMIHTQFNWYWYHIPTYAPYTVEGMFYPLILTHSSSTQSVKTSSIVLQSLTPNAQSVFKVLADHQLTHPDDEGKCHIIITFCMHVCMLRVLHCESVLSFRDAVQQFVHNLPRAVSR